MATRTYEIIVPNKPEDEDFLWDRKDDNIVVRLLHKLRWLVHDAWYFIKMFFDRKLNKGIAKSDLWSLDYTLAEYIYPRLMRFRNSDLHGYPNVFSEECEGGEQEAWLQVIDEIIFGFEYILYNDRIETPKGKKFWLKYYGETPWDEKDANKHHSYHYYMLEEKPDICRWVSCDRKLSDEECAKRKYELRRVETYYHNWDLEREAGERAQKALESFGKYFQNLWD